MAGGTALVICDIQNDIMRLHGTDEQAAMMVATTKRLIEWARASDITIIYSNVGFRDDYLDALPVHRAGMQHMQILRASSDGGKVIDELAPMEGDFVMSRQRTSSFYNTPLEIILRSIGADTLVVTGCSTARVVESTARDASDRGYRVIVVSDGCSASTPEFHTNALKSIADWFGEVKTGNEVISSLS